MDSKTLNAETQAIWNQKAAFWDEHMGEQGNDFQRILIHPASERLLHVQPGERVLEIACGNGNFARSLARAGAHVVATDFSENFLELARHKTTEHTDHIEYRLVDATDETQLLALGERNFSAAVCNMGLMDMAEIEPLFHALGKLLLPGARFVFSIMHPCFNTSGTTMMAELDEKNGQFTTVYSMKISQYLGLIPVTGVGIQDEPVAHYYFHRPLSVLLNTAFAAGFALDGLEEPAFSASYAQSLNRRDVLSWKNYTEIPPVLVARLRLL